MSCRRPCPSERKANKRSNVTVGTTHMSIAAIASAWLRRKVFQLCEGGLQPWIMYFETVDWACRFRKLDPPKWRLFPNQKTMSIDDRNRLPFRPHGVRLLQVATA